MHILWITSTQMVMGYHMDVLDVLEVRERKKKCGPWAYKWIQGEKQE